MMQRLALAMISCDSTSPHAPSFSCQAFVLTGSFARLCHTKSAQGQSLGYGSKWLGLVTAQAESFSWWKLKDWSCLINFCLISVFNVQVINSKRFTESLLSDILMKVFFFKKLKLTHGYGRVAFPIYEPGLLALVVIVFRVSAYTEAREERTATTRGQNV